VSEMTVTARALRAIGALGYRRFREGTIKEMCLQVFPKNRRYATLEIISRWKW